VIKIDGNVAKNDRNCKGNADSSMLCSYFTKYHQKSTAYRSKSKFLLSKSSYSLYDSKLIYSHFALQIKQFLLNLQFIFSTLFIGENNSKWKS